MMNTINKLILSLIILSLGISFSACQVTDNSNKLYIYNWGEYIDPSLLDSFSEQSGIEIVYEEFATNEDMYVKLKNGGTAYDIIFPSDYMIKKLINEDMLAKIDTSKLSNYKNIGKEFRGLDFDPQDQYSVPYFWGTAGIVYNKKLVDEKVDSWQILFNPKYKGKIFMLDSQRDTIMVGQKLLGYSMNSTDPKELAAVKELLLEQKEIVLAYVVDNGNHIMVQGGAALMPNWNGAAMDMMKENPDLDYVVPKEGGNIWYDSICIPKNAEHYQQALEFIDFMLDAENAAVNTDYVAYSTPNKAALALLDKEVRENPIAYPDLTELENSEVFLDLGENLQLYNRIWNEIKIK